MKIQIAHINRNDILCLTSILVDVKFKFSHIIYNDNGPLSATSASINSTFTEALRAEKINPPDNPASLFFSSLSVSGSLRILL